MPPKKQIPKKKQAWLNIVNRAVQLNVRPVISNTRHIRYIRTNLGRVDLERHGALTDAGREWQRRTRRPFRAAQTIQKVDYESSREYNTRDGLSKFIRGADGKPRYTQVWDPIQLDLRSTAHGRTYLTEGMASVHVEITITYWVTETS